MFRQLSAYEPPGTQRACAAGEMAKHPTSASATSSAAFSLDMIDPPEEPPNVKSCPQNSVAARAQRPEDDKPSRNRDQGRDFSGDFQCPNACRGEWTPSESIF